MSYGIVFIETRPLPGIREAFERHLPFVPNLEPFVACSAQNSGMFGGYKKSIFPNPGNNSGYNRMVTSPYFWKQIPFEKALICEHDSGILREGIEEFYDWDYVGAPWAFQQHGGNGGFSWRSIKAMISLSQKFVFSGRENEDVFFCNAMKADGNFKLAHREVCEKFSMEVIFKLGTFGYHAIKSHHGPKEVEHILNQYVNVLR